MEEKPENQNPFKELLRALEDTPLPSEGRRLNYGTSGYGQLSGDRIHREMQRIFLDDVNYVQSVPRRTRQSSIGMYLPADNDALNEFVEMRNQQNVPRDIPTGQGIIGQIRANDAKIALRKQLPPGTMLTMKSDPYATILFIVGQSPIRGFAYVYDEPIMATVIKSKRDNPIGKLFKIDSLDKYEIVDDLEIALNFKIDEP